MAGDGARNDGARRRAGGIAAARVASGPAGGWVRHLVGWEKRRGGEAAWQGQENEW